MQRTVSSSGGLHAAAQGHQLQQMVSKVVQNPTPATITGFIKFLGFEDISNDQEDSHIAKPHHELLLSGEKDLSKEHAYQLFKMLLVYSGKKDIAHEVKLNPVALPALQLFYYLLLYGMFDTGFC